MATSGVIGVKRFTFEQMLRLAFAACSKPISTVSGEVLQMARDRVQMMLWALSNNGVNLWCIRKNVFTLKAGQAVLPMAVGTVDVINALWRQLRELPGVASTGADFYRWTMLTPQYVRNISGTFTTAGTAELSVEASQDGGATWQNVTTLLPVDVEAGAAFSIDLDNSLLAADFRIVDGSGTLIPLSGVLFRTVLRELDIYKLNRDDYQDLPNKAELGERPVQFWYDKQINPQVWLWRVPQAGGDQVVVWSQSLIEDAGALTDELAVPLPWYLAIVAKCAEEVAFVIPAAELPPGRLAELQAKASVEYRTATNGESDGSSTSMLPNMAVYTR